jgi:GNAT superfamily N-acetyltransferase
MPVPEVQEPGQGVGLGELLVTRAGFRRRGISRALARAAVDFARERGVRALEGYPMITQPGQEITWGKCRSAAAASSPPPASPRSAGQPSAGP